MSSSADIGHVGVTASVAMTLAFLSKINSLCAGDVCAGDPVRFIHLASVAAGRRCATHMNQIVKLALLSLTMIVALALLSLYFPEGVDWRETYRPSVLAVLSGRTPYGVGVSPCLSPNVLIHGWAGPLAAILQQPLETLAVVVG